MASRLVVTAQVDGQIVWYTIQSDRDGTDIKTARFSELHALHRALIAEVPTFPGMFPSKTLKRYTSNVFIESRRRDIEMYLRLVATHQVASRSKAWLTFKGGGVTEGFEVSVSNIDGPQAPRASGIGGEEAGDDSEDEGGDDFVDLLNATTNSLATVMREMGSSIYTKRDELKEAQESKHALEMSISFVEQTLNSADDQAKDQAAFEAGAALCLRYHLLSLEELDTKLGAAQSFRSEEGRRHVELVKRFQDELPAVSESAKNAELSLDKAKQACQESASKTRAKVADLMAEQVAAETANEAAIERHGVMNAAMGVLQERAKARLEDCKAAEREVVILKSAQQALAAENSQAESQRVDQEAAAAAAAAAVVTFTREAESRSRAQEVDVGRAEEWATDLASVRDMKTRPLLKEVDRNACKPFKSSAIAAADTAAATLARAKQLRDETKTSDEQQLQALQAIENKARKRVGYRETFTAVLAARLEDGEAAVHKASAKQAAVGAALKAIQEELESIKLRVEGPLAEALPKCASRVEEVEKALAAAKKQGEEEQTPLRHAEEAQLQVVQKHRAEHAALLQKYEKAQVAAAEAQEGIVLRTEDTEAPRNKIDLLVKACEARCVESEKQATEASEAYETYEKAAADLQEEAEKVVQDNSLDHWTQKSECKKVKDAADADVIAVKEELADLLAQQKATPVPGWYTKRIVHEELAIVRTGLQNHEDSEKAILAESKQQMADWLKQQETLAADLRHAELEVSVAKENEKATKTWMPSKKGPPPPPGKQGNSTTF